MKFLWTCTCQSIAFTSMATSVTFFTHFFSCLLCFQPILLQEWKSLSYLALVSHTLCPVFRVEYHSLHSLFSFLENQLHFTLSLSLSFSIHISFYYSQFIFKPTDRIVFCVCVVVFQNIHSYFHLLNTHVNSYRSYTHKRHDIFTSHMLNTFKNV